MEPFGRTASGEEVHLLGLSGGGLSAEVMTLGATIRSLRLDGWPHPLTLGFATLDDYVRVRGYVGVVAGRYANRIAAGRFPVDGRIVELDRNEGANTLHGGTDGFAFRVWNVIEASAAHLRLALTSPAGDQGFPGHLEASVTYRLRAPGTLEMTFEATTDAATVVNLTQHSYFTLDGAPTIDGHALEVWAPSYVPVDGASLPLGGTADVAGTPFDLTAPRTLADAQGPLRLDHNYCLADVRRPEPVEAARLTVPGLAMTLATTEPGLQVYTGDKLQRGPLPRAGLCLEPQIWPDAPNRPDFPSPLLRPGEVYSHRTVLTFQRS